MGRCPIPSRTSGAGACRAAASSSAITSGHVGSCVPTATIAGGRRSARRPTVGRESASPNVSQMMSVTSDIRRRRLTGHWDRVSRDRARRTIAARPFHAVTSPSLPGRRLRALSSSSPRTRPRLRCGLERRQASRSPRLRQSIPRPNERWRFQCDLVQRVRPPHNRPRRTDRSSQSPRDRGSRKRPLCVPRSEVPKLQPRSPLRYLPDEDTIEVGGRNRLDLPRPCRRWLRRALAQCCASWIILIPTRPYERQRD
jgi:hypothetical protein